MRVKAIICLTAFLLALCGCAPESRQITFYALDTVISIRLIRGGSDELLQQAVSTVNSLEAVLDCHDGELARVNREGGRVSKELREALTEALALCRETDGAFDITVGGLTELWDFKKATVPSREDILTALETVGYERVSLRDGVLDTGGARLDLGAFAKGYICDKVCQMLKSGGVQSAILDFGGNIYCIGDKSGKDFSIGIASPSGGDPVATISIRDTSAVTSGIYQRSFTVDGVSYHHIIDPKTGMPAQNELASATVICSSAARADALSTAIMVQGKNSPLLKGERVVLVLKDGSVNKNFG